MPFCSARSSRPPALTQMPMAAEYRPGMSRVTTRRTVGQGADAGWFNVLRSRISDLIASASFQPG